ncbi:hypothetical protein C7271_14460 [filamentous cyanobacterium CCP5]|nr:hypothetical protein C7271_14460 [filamentous cyanobacterium CCP5]
MAIIALKAWYLDKYEPVRQLEQRPHDLRLSKNSLLKTGLRADFLDDSEEVREAAWFQRYLEGEPVEFYIEGGGGYAIANIDLISHEIYFVKQETTAHLDPVILLCHQEDYPESTDLLQAELEALVEKLNPRSRVPLSLDVAHRLSEGPARLSSSLTRKIRQCLLFVADGTPITRLDGSPPQLIPSPKVCVEMGYALQSRRPEQILLAQMERSDLSGQFPFDLNGDHRLTFTGKADLHKQLPALIEAKLARYHLWK